MSELNAVSGKPVITFSCDDKQICEEIIALKTCLQPAQDDA